MTAVTNGLVIPLQQLVGVDGCRLTLALCPCLERLQQPHLLAVDEWLIRHQAAVKGALLKIAPNLGANGLCPCHCHWVIPATQTVDEGILPVNPHPHLQAAVLVAERGWFQHGGGGLLTPGLRLRH